MIHKLEFVSGHLFLQSKHQLDGHRFRSQAIISSMLLPLPLLSLVFYSRICFELSALKFIPMIMSIADTEKIIGQSLKGRNSTPKPVNNDNMAIENSIPTIKM